jgi:hypothetical protein
MTQRIPIEDLNPPPISRFRVEAAMIELIEKLRVQGLSQAEIAVSLADAAEEYVLRLANKLELDDVDAGNHRH